MRKLFLYAAAAGGTALGIALVLLASAMAALGCLLYPKYERSPGLA